MLERLSIFCSVEKVVNLNYDGKRTRGMAPLNLLPYVLTVFSLNAHKVWVEAVCSNFPTKTLEIMDSSHFIQNTFSLTLISTTPCSSHPTLLLNAIHSFIFLLTSHNFYLVINKNHKEIVYTIIIISQFEDYVKWIQKI